MDPAFVIPRVEKSEGRAHHMYRCTGVEVTIGIGHAIQTPADALNFTWTVNDRPATAALFLQAKG
ncbi:MAG: hypothetical protein NTW28_03870 [Candidatus Solibacter sp.]|nr:hypothetical protein [Candidatus Solibacter sp.]